MTMKKFIILLGILVAANVLVAQERGRGEDRREELKQLLDLSDEQASQLEAVHQKYKPEFQNIKQDESITRSDKMRAAADLMDQREADVQSILTQDQFEKLTLIKQVRSSDRKRHRERMRQRMKHRRN